MKEKQIIEHLVKATHSADFLARDLQETVTDTDNPFLKEVVTEMLQTAINLKSDLQKYLRYLEPGNGENKKPESPKS